MVGALQADLTVSPSSEAQAIRYRQKQLLETRVWLDGHDVRSELGGMSCHAKKLSTG
jgi:hypothetical protein